MKREVIYRTDAMAAVGDLKGLSDTDKSKTMQAILDVLTVQTCEDAVSRQAAIDAVLRAEALVRAYGYRYAADAVRELPSVQPQITHCAECIHWKHSDVRKSYCEVFDWVNDAEDFCSFAERKDTE